MLASETVYEGRVISPAPRHRRDARRRGQRPRGRAPPGRGRGRRPRRPGPRGPRSASTAIRSATHLWELPAGLRDADGEPPLETAKRELAEEALLAADRWSLLATSYSSPGFCDEQVLIYLAEGLSDAERPEGFIVEHEELDMTVDRVPLDDAVQRIFDGDIRNASAIVGLLAAARARSPPRLRPVDAG